MRFTKMHGLGNDYVYVDMQRCAVADAAALARRISDRHTGVGSDGLILIGAPTVADADVRMILYNADGSRGEMCGNGLRCVARYARDRGLSARNPLRVQTDAGVRTAELRIGAGGVVESVWTDLGRPRLAAAEIPTTLAAGAASERWPREAVLDATLRALGREFRVACVSMGNPHAIVFVERCADVPLSEWGPALERHAVFPERTNVHFVECESERRLRVVTWERGSGATRACGSGAAAALVAAVLTGRAERRVVVAMPGGELEVRWESAESGVQVSGPAEYVCDGEWLG
ncbi:MAG: diaminopimelate epimerase [Phycisphaerales bacterium]|nr:diaminopimelate epimerase [Phycisphaerales bacterium]